MGGSGSLQHPFFEVLKGFFENDPEVWAVFNKVIFLIVIHKIIFFEILRNKAIKINFCHL